MGDAHPGERLSAFLDDELDDAEALVVTRHVAVCPACLDELEAIARARAAVRDLPALAVPTELLAAVPAAALAATRRRRLTFRLTAGTFACVAGVLTVAFAAGSPEPGYLVPPVEVFVVDHVVRTGGGPVLTPVRFESP